MKKIILFVVVCFLSVYSFAEPKKQDISIEKDVRKTDNTVFDISTITKPEMAEDIPEEIKKIFKEMVVVGKN